MDQTLKLYTLEFRETRTYLFALLFIVGNIVLPQLCHLIPNGGHTWLPIYFFTLIGAYKYGMKVGLLTAIFSPLVNATLFHMPGAAALPAILLKGTLLALAAGWCAQRFQKVSLGTLLLVVLSYQIIGSLGECLIEGSWLAGLTDFKMGLPGMALQVVGGYLVIKYLFKN
ncbi:MAG: ECF transporter S component [Paludibacteraceae bacterium]|nr:ECF transporter S component [Paludibacteraceae bacterium]